MNCASNVLSGTSSTPTTSVMDPREVTPRVTKPIFQREESFNKDADDTVLLQKPSPAVPEEDQNPQQLSSTTSSQHSDSGSPHAGTAAAAAPKALPADFQPGPYDVWCGRGRACKNAPGNVAYRRAVLEHLPAYAAAATKMEKGLIITGIVDAIRLQCHEYHERVNQLSGCGGFVKRCAVTGEWMEVGDFLAREKTSQCFRDALSENYSSSAQCKYQRRRARERQQHQQHLGHPEVEREYQPFQGKVQPLLGNEIEPSERKGEPSNSDLPPKKRKCRPPEDYAIANALQSLATMNNPPAVAVTTSSDSTPSCSPAPIAATRLSTQLPHSAPRVPMPMIQPGSDHPASELLVPIASASRQEGCHPALFDEVRVCALQPYLRTSFENPVDAVLRIQHQIVTIASSEIVDLFVLPELSPIGYSEHTFARYLPVTLENQRMHSEIDRIFQETARALGVYICYGTIGYNTTATTSNNVTTNSTLPPMFIRQVVVDRSGRQIAVYDKTHLCDYGVCAETRFFQPGPYSRPVSFSVTSARNPRCSLRFGLLICSDIRYPELSRKLTAEHGVDAILQPAAFARDCSFRTWSAFRETRAVENSVYFVGVNYAGIDFGESAIVAPWVDEEHEPLTLGREQGFLIGRISRRTLDQVRNTMPFYRKLISSTNCAGEEEGTNCKPGVASAGV